jgi:hypothetical protein
MTSLGRKEVLFVESSAFDVERWELGVACLPFVTCSAKQGWTSGVSRPTESMTR